MYRGDIRLGDTIDLKFSTRSFTTGVPTTLAGTPVISAYVGNGTTEITAGITLTVDFDGRAGLHNVRVVATSGNGFATATNIDLVITTGTVGGVSVVGEVIGSFSIENRSALMPTTAAATLDVTATGAAGVDWGNVENKTTTNALTNTSIITTQKVDVDTIKTNPVVNAGTFTFPANATGASTTNITAGVVSLANGSFVTATFGTCDLTSTMKTSVTTAATAATPTVTVSDKTGFSLLNGSFVTATFGTCDLTATMKTSVTTAATAATPTIAATQVFNNTGTWTGNLTGTVNAVVTSVGSVAGNVGGNVLGGVAGDIGGDVNGNVLGDVEGKVLGQGVSNFTAVGVWADGRAGDAISLAATALSTAQWTNTLATNLGTLAGHDPGGTIGTSTLTQTQVTGGAYSVQSASCVLGDARIGNLDAAVTSRASATVAPSWYSTAPTAAAISTALLKFDLSTITGEADYSPLNALRKLRSKIDTTTNIGFLTVFKEDGTTPAYTQALVVSASAQLITSAG